LRSGGSGFGSVDLEGLIEVSAALFVYGSGAVNMMLDRFVTER
jgi:hypothetical protein